MLRIKEAREARGWTQEQLAAAMNTTQQTIRVQNVCKKCQGKTRKRSLARKRESANSCF